jgi:hypothetical protein
MRRAVGSSWQRGATAAIDQPYAPPPVMEYYSPGQSVVKLSDFFTFAPRCGSDKLLTC